MTFTGKREPQEAGSHIHESLDGESTEPRALTTPRFTPLHDHCSLPTELIHQCIKILQPSILDNYPAAPIPVLDLYTQAQRPL